MVSRLKEHICSYFKFSHNIFWKDMVICTNNPTIYFRILMKSLAN